MKKNTKKNKNIQIYKKRFIDDFKINNNKQENKYKSKINKNIQINYNLNLNQTINEIKYIDKDEEDELNDEDSFENFCMHTARNKWRKSIKFEKKEEAKKNLEYSKKKIETIKIKPKNKEDDSNKVKEIIKLDDKNKEDDSNKKIRKSFKLKEIHELLEIKDTLKIYKYGDIPPKSPHKLIYEYYYDEFNQKDIEKAHIILFIGKTGDGKSTAINALFNIIKGIKLEDNYRYILIKELKKKKGQAESQTDGLHFYYIKDYLKNPIIIIDSQGFGDTRGKDYDELIKKSFEYAFNNIIKYINTICFIAKSTDCRLDISTKYIFSSVTSLFSDDICENLIFLTTFANKGVIYDGPDFIKSISSNSNFSSIIKKMSKKWYYVAESINILDNEKDKLTVFSFEQLNALYNEKIINSKAKNIKKSCEVINNRNKVQSISKNIISIYRNILDEKKKIPDIENKINAVQNKIEDINFKIDNKNLEISSMYIPDKDYQLSQIESNIDRIIRRLENEYEEKEVHKLKYVGGEHTYCNSCERNCHEYCGCIGGFLNNCTVFPLFSSYCESCDHHKSNHSLHSGYKWVDEIERKKVDNYSRIQEERDYYWRRYNEITDEYNQKMNKKAKRQNELNGLKNQKSEIESEKNKYENEKNDLNSSIKKIISDLKINCLDLKKIARSIKDIAMNQFHFEVENEYIETCITRIEDIGGENKEELKGLREYKKYNDVFLKINELSDEEIIISDEDNFFNKISKII